MERSTMVKVTYQGNSHRFAMKNIYWDSLITKIAQSFQLPTTPEGNFDNGLQLTYVDEDKDSITLYGNEELVAAIYQIQSNQPNPSTLRLWVVSDSPNSASTTSWTFADEMPEEETVTHQRLVNSNETTDQDVGIPPLTSTEDNVSSSPLTTNTTAVAPTATKGKLSIDAGRSKPPNEISANSDNDIGHHSIVSNSTSDHGANSSKHVPSLQLPPKTDQDNKTQGTAHVDVDAPPLVSSLTEAPTPQTETDLSALGAQFANLFQQFCHAIQQDPKIAKNTQALTLQTLNEVESSMVNLFHAVREQLGGVSPDQPVSENLENSAGSDTDLRRSRSHPRQGQMPAPDSLILSDDLPNFENNNSSTHLAQCLNLQNEPHGRGIDTQRTENQQPHRNHLQNHRFHLYGNQHYQTSPQPQPPRRVDNLSYSHTRTPEQRRGRTSSASPNVSLQTDPHTSISTGPILADYTTATPRSTLTNPTPSDGSRTTPPIGHRGYNESSTALPPPDAHEHQNISRDDMLGWLIMMGFEDRELNLRLLERYNGDMDRVVNELADNVGRIVQNESEDSDDIYR